MKPEQCGFDGAKGLQLLPPGGMYSGGLVLRLFRGKKPPKGGFSESRRNCLLWYYPDEQPAKLLYINAEGSWYELDFIPLDNPFE